MKPDRTFRIAFLIAALLIAGGVSYLASSSPDGLDSATLRGCEVVDRDGAEQLAGQCIAQSARDHPMSGSPLAGYTLDGARSGGGAAGIIGVAVTLAAAGALFRVLSRGRTGGAETAGSGT